ncbi:palmitoyltransferase ZDHHC18-like isoform X1 [Syngnathus acus]|uniref:palmitoyltransferase ZDHHC18-like isoform X1 n=1 Tax=Syngnathus acus TaxID=161584 RepID=UPI0018862175|nr:palmitoyltransferase ZDHHC18-like isoform X1 [Syngnathus acus]XP_037120613.1 palmitoyltransferase ZDHHC18-like isoform X1 [Syngnathus acus]
MNNRDYQQIDSGAPGTHAATSVGHHPQPQNGKQHHVEDRSSELLRRPRRRWEVLPGKNRFFCDGRLITAGQSGMLPLTLGLILVTSGLFFIFDCPFLVKHLTGCIPAIGGVLFVFVLVTLLQTTFSDPGILPRATTAEAIDIEKQIDDMGRTSYRPPPRTKEILINQQVVKLKYCFTCKMFRPPRTSHCSLCDNCVERFDHHCPWVGNCVGKRNYRFFYAFIVSLSFLTAFIFGCVATHLTMRAQDGQSLLYALQESPGSAVELVICFFSVWCILGLSGFHTYLVAVNLTTNEDIKGTWSGKRDTDVTNPYSHRNIFVNCCAVLCGPMPPSLINRRGLLRTDEPAQTDTDIELTTSTRINVPKHVSKGLSESTAHTPLLSTQCPQGKSQSVLDPAKNPNPTVNTSKCETDRSAGSPPRNTSHALPAQTKAKKTKKATAKLTSAVHASRHGQREEP